MSFDFDEKRACFGSKITILVFQVFQVFQVLQVLRTTRGYLNILIVMGDFGGGVKFFEKNICGNFCISHLIVNFGA